MKQLTIFTCLLAITLVSHQVMAQATFPTMTTQASPDKKTEHLGLSELKVESRILGPWSETKMTMTFKNPHSRNLAGNLYFPLPEGATVSGYGLDVNGVLVDGVVVEKAEGRRVYEKIARRGVDPGIAEWVKGNCFRTRVFPIPPNGTRTIMVKYVSQLPTQRGRRVYQLPMAFPNKIPKMSITVEVISTGKRPVVESQGPLELSFANWEHGFRAVARGTDVQPNQNIRVLLPATEGQSVYIEKGLDDQYYFAIPVDTPTLGIKVADRTPPNKLTIFWDASSSRAILDHRRELELISWYLLGLKETVSVDLVPFSNELLPTQNFQIDSSEALGQLVTAIGKINYDGGTQMGSLSDYKPEKAPDICLLFSDGMSTFGSSVPAQLPCPVTVISQSTTANHSLLRHLAEQSGGNYINLLGMTQRKALDLLRTVPLRLLQIKASSNQINQLQPRPPSLIAAQFTVTGILHADSASIGMTIGTSDTNSEQKTFTIAKKDAVLGNLLQRIWAQNLIEKLSVFPKKHKAKITEIGKKFSIVTPGTSLIVLESLSQYVEFKIPPPETLPDMRREYANRINSERKRSTPQAKDPSWQVSNQWQALVSWWNTEYQQKPAKPSKPVTPQPTVRRGGSAARSESVTVEAPTADADVNIQELRISNPGGNASALILPGVMAMRSSSGRKAARRGGSSSPGTTTSRISRVESRDETWLAGVQNSDGSWGKAKTTQPSLTSLAVLAYLSKGITPASSSEGQSLSRALKWLMDYSGKNRQQNGIISCDEDNYGHALITTALAEAYAMTKLPQLQKSMEPSVAAILATQKINGTYALKYGRRGTNDLPFSALNYLALKSAFAAGSETDGLENGIDRSIQALERVYFRGNGFSQDGRKRPDNFMNSIGLLCLQQLGSGRSRVARTAIAKLDTVKHIPNWETNEQLPLLQWYCMHNTLFSRSAGTTREWRAWQRPFLQMLMNGQKQDGSWLPPKSSKMREILAPEEQAVYATCIATLMFETFYRYLPTTKLASAHGASVDDQDLVVEVDDDNLFVSFEPEGKQNDKYPWQHCFDNIPPSSLYAIYLKYLPRYRNTPGFFLSAATELAAAGKQTEAVRALTNIVELKLEDSTLVRKMAYKLLELGEIDLAVNCFREVMDMREEEPQSFRDLALSLAQRAQATGSIEDYREALSLLNQVLARKWDRFDGIQGIALTEANRLIPKAQAAGVTDIPIPEKFHTLLTPDLRVVLTWDTDATDIDLWVTEPSGEKAYYEHTETQAGGLMSRDFTRGHGPEVYMLKKAPAGEYKIQANYYGSRSTEILGLVTIRADIYQNYGQKNETHQTIIRSLKETKGVVDIAAIKVPEAKQ